MRMFFSTVALALVTATTASGGLGPFRLVSLPVLGTITWRCKTASSRDTRHALAFRAFSLSATTTIRFTAGKLTRRVVVQPGSTARLPWRAQWTQRLALTQSTEPRTLHALVTVRFLSGQICSADMPPNVGVRVWSTSH
jgi:hypothetical protein